MKLAFLGDSITLGYGLADRSDRFSTRICASLGAEEANFGITGTLMARAGLSRADGTAFIDRVGLIADADAAVIFGGTNDYFWSDRPIDGDGAEHFRTAVDEICRAVTTSRAPGTTLLVTPYPHHGIGNFAGGETWRTSSEHDTSARNWCAHTLADYVVVLAEAGARWDIPTLNLHEVRGFDWRIHTSDGCHPNPAGHAWLAQVIGERLRALL